MYLIQGKTYANLTPEQTIALLNERLDNPQDYACHAEAVIACAETFIQRLQESAFIPQLDASLRQEIITFCQPTALRNKLERELGDNPFSLRRIDYQLPHFESWRALGVVVHITPANAPLLPFFALLESLLVGNVNWLRPSSSDRGLTAQLLQAFLKGDDRGELANFIAVLPVSAEQLPQLIALADGVSAWGSDTALTAIRQMLPNGCRWITWGHKISFAYLVPDALDDAIFDAAVDEVCRFDQQACSSPQLIFIDSDDPAILQTTGQRLAQAFERRHPQWPALTPSEREAADITSYTAFTRLDRAFATAENSLWIGNGWRIIWQHETAIEPSPLFRTVLLRPLPRQQLLQALRPWRAQLQTCGLATTPQDMAPLSQLIISAGVNRITPVQNMHDGYAGEPHDGVYALSRLAKRVSVTLAVDMLPRQATLDLLPAAPAIPENTPIMGKQQFLRDSLQPCAQLFFRSGGSSGDPKLAGFTWRDYHRQMQAAADGLFAAGLDPACDKVMNLMYAGNLYGGLLSFFTLLDKLKATNYPMGGPDDDNYSEVARLIVQQGIDTLIGMPATIYQLFQREADTLRAYGGVKKLLLGGEHIGTELRAYLQRFGVTTIRSAIYGSVDAGPLGYACHASPDGIFHLMSDIQWLEIVDLDRDEAVSDGETGRLLFTSKARDGQKIMRYDIGDTGRWVKGICACGNASPRFELLERHGNLVRIGTMFIQPQRLASLAQVPVQLILEYAPGGGDRIRLLADGDAGEVRRRVITDGELVLALKTALLEFEVISQPFALFERHAQSGKTPLVIDKRLQAGK
ncbi:long-chain-fatty-acyl-CoA reductase [Erwinia sp. PK3-005]